MDGDYLKLLKVAKKKVDKNFFLELNLLGNQSEKKEAVGKSLLRYLEQEIDFLKKKLYLLELKGQNVFNLNIYTSILENRLHFFKSNYSFNEFYKIESLLEKINIEVRNGST